MLANYLDTKRKKPSCRDEGLMLSAPLFGTAVLIYKLFHRAGTGSWQQVQLLSSFQSPRLGSGSVYTITKI